MDFKRVALRVMPPLILAGTCGCLATDQRVGELQDQVDALNSSLSVMQKNQADLNVKMDVLSRNLSVHAETLRDFDNQLVRLSGKIDDLQALMVQRLSVINQSIEKQQKQQEKERADAEEAMLPSKIYSESSSYLLRKNYKMAAQGFQLYLEKFPDGILAENSYYYLGDAYAGLEDWKNSAISYATILEKYKNSQYTAAARLKYAQALLKMPGDNSAEAIRYLKSVVADFPDSHQAVLAKDQLKKLQPATAQPAASATAGTAKPKSKWKPKKPAAPAPKPEGTK